ncbi:MAG: type II toxin-antitoxin system HipA family toxin [Blastochloris viridis]|uniref:Type II toxin-antitoxin system HipA family toxin n=1 Tax=Blastochloris viridis TaxID=1079 RepID=A0A6N4RAN2_BLAVI|nr:MAG: type II toxin-antitoxin system HipA family toxin [Blastochloris viridis]
MKYEPVNSIKVGLNFSGTPIPVGTLALNQSRIYFEYEPAFLEGNLPISPFQLPLKAGLREFERDLFEGLPGVFNDSLPDGWGRLLLDRMLIGQGLVPQQLSPLDRLAYVGMNGMGALVYEPEINPDNATPTIIDLDNLAQAAQAVLDGESKEVLSELISLNGSSAGARPKALIAVNADKTHIIHGQQAIPDGYEPWLVKFPNSGDGADAGAIEYIYALMAKEAGLEMMPCHLFPAAKGAGYFATQRFDRVDGKRLHLHSLCGLLHDDFRHPSLDYETVMLATHKLTKDMREVAKAYRMAVFNVLAHNRDDHSKNFAFLMDSNGEWKLSPVYDITFSSGPQGYQSMLVMGEGRNPTVEHLLKLGETANFERAWMMEVITQTQAALAKWPQLASQYGISKDRISLVQSHLCVM